MAYCTVVLRYVAADEGTEFHPKTLSGPDCAQAWGQFSSEAEAHQWAARNLRGRAYQVVWIDDEGRDLPNTIPAPPGWGAIVKEFLS